MLSSLVSVEAESELLDTSESLEFRSVNQTHHQFAFIGVRAKANDVVNGIAIDAFRQDELRPANGFEQSLPRIVTLTLPSHGAQLFEPTSEFKDHTEPHWRTLSSEIQDHVDLDR